jgi:uncharacterized protein (UPF0303 family)
MTVDADIALIKRQEAELVLPRFDEDVAFELGRRIRERAVREGLSLVVDVRSWDRQLFFAATAGTMADNAEWASELPHAARARGGRVQARVGDRRS